MLFSWVYLKKITMEHISVKKTIVGVDEPAILDYFKAFLVRNIAVIVGMFLLVATSFFGFAYVSGLTQQSTQALISLKTLSGKFSGLEHQNNILLLLVDSIENQPDSLLLFESDSLVYYKEQLVQTEDHFSKVLTDLNSANEITTKQEDRILNLQWENAKVETQKRQISKELEFNKRYVEQLITKNDTLNAELKRLAKKCKDLEKAQADL